MKRSIDQIDEDFGGELFPGLTRYRDEDEFEICVVSKIRKYKDLSDVLVGCIWGDYDEEVIPLEFKENILVSKKEVGDSVQEIDNEKIANALKWSMKKIAPIYFFWREEMKKGAIPSMGYFHPIIKNKIFVSHDLQEKMDVVVSHEHIHLLQNKYSEFNVAKSFSFNFVYDEYADHATYFLNKKEMEARFHEILISRKMRDNRLPCDYEELLWFLLGDANTGFFCLGRVPDLDFCENDEDFRLENDFFELTSRSIKKNNDYIRLQFIEDQFNSAIWFLKREFRAKFVLEVLPLLYCNLLNYYGYRELSKEISCSINRPNFYDQFYG